MILFALAALVLAGPTTSQKERCKPNAKRGSMACINRVGHCIAVTVDGQPTVPLTDKATAIRVHSIKHHQDVCWRLAAPVSTRFRARAQGSGIDPSFVGEVLSLDVNLYPLDDYDPQTDSQLDQIYHTRMEADGHRNGTWQVRTPHPLAAGEYIAHFRVSGTDNWDGQTVLVTLDPALPPGPEDEGRPGRRR